MNRIRCRRAGTCRASPAVWWAVSADPCALHRTAPGDRKPTPSARPTSCCCCRKGRDRSSPTSVASSPRRQLPEPGCRARTSARRRIAAKLLARLRGGRDPEEFRGESAEPRCRALARKHSGRGARAELLVDEATSPAPHAARPRQTLRRQPVALYRLCPLAPAPRPTCFCSQPRGTSTVVGASPDPPPARCPTRPKVRAMESSMNWAVKRGIYAGAVGLRSNGDWTRHRHPAPPSSG